MIPLHTKTPGLKGDVRIPSATEVAFAVALNGAFVTPGLYVAGVRGWRLALGSVLGGVSYVFFSVLWGRYMLRRAGALPGAQPDTPSAPRSEPEPAGTGRVIDVPPRRS